MNKIEEEKKLFFGLYKQGSGYTFIDRSYLLRVLLIVVFSVVLARFFFLQVLTGTNQMVLAEGNRIEKQIIDAKRGVIKDRYGEILARNMTDETGRVIREYPYGDVLAHVIGYVGEASEEQIENSLGVLRPGTMVGKDGIEKQYDKNLGGVSGERLVESSSLGETVRVVAEKPQQPGTDVELYADIKLSQEIHRILSEREVESGGFKGAVIVSKVNGEVLSLVSWPSFDLNLFSKPESEGGYYGKYQKVKEVLSDTTYQPLFDRAIGGLYPPGSTFKLVTAIAGLSLDKIDEETKIEDTGELVVGDYRYGNWFYDQYGQKDGEVDLVKATARSNDIFFYKVGEWVGVDELVKSAIVFGFSQPTGVDLPLESSGTVPTPLWKERLTGERWFLGNTYHLAIGQGDLLATPFQVNRMTANIMSSKKCIPRVAKTDRNECRDLEVDRGDRELMLKAMKAVCKRGDEYNGTAFPFFDFPIPVACKTGTAQQGGDKDHPHAWITVVLPGSRKDGDQLVFGDSLESFERGVVITVLLEGAGEGSYEAGPVAYEVAKSLLDSKILME